MLERATVAAWLDAYVHAWKTYDPEAIGNLFSEDATYAYDPFSEPVRGRASIVASWLENQDTPGTYDGQYEPLFLAGHQAVTNGCSRYFEQDGSMLRAEWDNLFVLSFDEEGRCSDYREWYMPRPEEHAE
jgi:SnoaL-like domain